LGGAEADGSSGAVVEPSVTGAISTCSGLSGEGVSMPAAEATAAGGVPDVTAGVRATVQVGEGEEGDEEEEEDGNAAAAARAALRASAEVSVLLNCLHLFQAGITGAR